MKAFKKILLALIFISSQSLRAQDAGKAIQLDGVDDFVHVNLLDHNFSNFTFECWINVPTYDGNVHYISNQQNAAIYLGDYSSGVMSSWATGLTPVDAASSIVGDQPSLNTDEWHHFAITFDGSSQKIIIDGVLVGDVATTGTVTLDNVTYNLGMNIGARYTGSTQFVQGLMDEVRVWTIARTPEEIDTYKNELIGPQSGLVGYWRFDGNSSDFSGNNQDGLLNGGVSYVVSDAPISDTVFERVSVGDIVNDLANNYHVSWGDYNNDGYPDLFVPGIGSSKLHRNNGDGTFTQVIAGDLGDDGDTSYGSTWGDYDNDGDLDLFVANNGNNALYQNNGDETFTQVAGGELSSDGLFSTNAAWADYNNDGFLDIFVANNSSQANYLYFNNGDGTFTRDTGFFPSDLASSWSCAWGDYDDDGYIDLFVTNSGALNYLYNNDGDGTFTKVTTGPVSTDNVTNYSAAWGDYDNDGDLDLYVPSSFSNNLLYNNDGSGNFTKITTGAIVTETADNWSGSWGDYDNDGRLDLLLAANGKNSLFRNQGSGNFIKVENTLVTSENGYSLGSAWADYDLDGDLDLFVANSSGSDFFYINHGNGNRWLNVKLESAIGNASAIDAKVELVGSSGNSQLRQLNTINGRGQGTTNVEFGLAGNDIRHLIVTWPSGMVQSVKTTANQFINVVEDEVDDRPSVLLLAAENQTRAYDVRDKLIATTKFSKVEFVNASSETPNLAYLQAYDIVFVWSNSSFLSNTEIGDVLADYIDGGGKVMSAVFATASVPISGRFSPDYEVLNPLNQTQGTQLTLGTVLLPDHPIMNKVSTFDGGTQSFKSTSTSIATGATIVAEWSDGTPLIVVKEGVGAAGVRRVDLNFWPVSSDAFGTNWVSSTDGDRIMANALMWLIDPPDQFSRVTGGVIDEMGSSWSVSWGDFTGDGFDDLFIGNPGVADFLYENNGDGTFTKNITDDVVIPTGTTYGASWGDYDNDGDLDLFVANSGGNDLIYANNGDGTLTQAFDFEDGANSTCGAWGDFNSDGFLDLFVATQANNFLYLNNGDGTFQDITPGIMSAGTVASWTATWGDYNDDNHPDLYVANFDAGNYLYQNNGDGSFTEIITGDIVTDVGSSVGATWGDYDNDGYLDLYVTNFSNINNILYRNNSGDGTFTKALTGSIVTDASSSTSSAWVDYDNDGWKDLFVATSGSQNDLIYKNNGDGTFTQINTWSPTLESQTTYGSGWADYDRDGDEDLVVANFGSGNNLQFINNQSTNNWLNITLEGVTSNSFGVGAKVYVYDSDGNAQMKVVEAVSGFGVQNSIDLNFGLGSATSVDQINIVWPSGFVQNKYDIAANQFITIMEDVIAPDVFIVGDVTTVGGTTVPGVWNSTNTSLEVAIPLPADPTLQGGTIQLLASIDGGSYQNLGGENTIALGAIGTTQIVSVSDTDVTNLSGYTTGAILRFNAILTDASFLSTEGVESETVLVVVPDVIAIDNEDFPEYFNMSGGDQFASITLSTNLGIDVVNVSFLGATQPSSDVGIVEANTSDGFTYTFDLSTIKDTGELLGLGYVFEVLDLAGNSISSNVGITHLEYPDDSSPTIPGLKFGSTEADYQIIAIPLELNSNTVSSVFADDLGSVDNTKWRIFHYDNGTTRELSGSSQIDIDEGYWLIAKNSTTIDVGAGSTPQVTKVTPFQIDLSSGWNQIGNPYNFNISWQEVLDYNGNPTGVDSDLTIYNGGFASSNILERYKGAFVFSSSDMTLDIPVVKNNSIQGRKGRQQSLKNPIDHSNWNVDLVLKSGSVSYTPGGIGMNELASAQEKDKFDRLTVPRFIKYLEMNFDETWQGNNLTKSVLPTNQSQAWNFIVSSNITNEVEISWDNSYWGDSDMQLVLFDKVAQKHIDMRNQSSYTFDYSGERDFSIYYGKSDFISNSLTPSTINIGEPHPNPFTQKSTILFTIPLGDVYNVELTIYDQLGAVVKVISQADLTAGYHEMSWDGTNDHGARASSGIYFGKMDVVGSESNARFTQRFVLK